MSKFTFSSARTPTSSFLKQQQQKQEGENRVSLSPLRTDHAQQVANAALHRSACDRESIEKMQTKATAISSSRVNVAFSLNALLNEARRRDLASQINREDEHAKIRVRSGWSQLLRQLDEFLASRRLQDPASTLSDALDIISVLGVHFSDLPSPAYGRRPQAILDIYFRHVDNQDISHEIAAFDHLHKIDTGKVNCTNFNNNNNNTEEEGEQVQQQQQHNVQPYYNFAIAPPTFEQTPYVAQSRELRQLSTLRRIAVGSIQFALPPAIAVIEQEEQKQQVVEENYFCAINIDDDEEEEKDEQSESLQQQQEEEQQEDQFNTKVAPLPFDSTSSSSSLSSSSFNNDSATSTSPQQQEEEHQIQKQVADILEEEEEEVSPVKQLFIQFEASTSSPLNSTSRFFYNNSPSKETEEEEHQQEQEQNEETNCFNNNNNNNNVEKNQTTKTTKFTSEEMNANKKAIIFTTSSTTSPSTTSTPLLCISTSQTSKKRSKRRHH